MFKSSSLILWGAYVVFAGGAMFMNWHDGLLDFSGRLGSIKLVVWLLLIGFLVYSLYCTSKENLFRTVGKMNELYWGRQIGADLYLGLLVALLIIYLNEGLVTMLVWLLPVLAFANLAILLYVALHFDSLVATFAL